MRQYLDLVRENMTLRKRVEAGIRSADRNFVIAKAGNVRGGAQYGAAGSEAGSGA